MSAVDRHAAQSPPLMTCNQLNSSPCATVTDTIIIHSHVIELESRPAHIIMIMIMIIMIIMIIIIIIIIIVVVVVGVVVVVDISTYAQLHVTRSQ